MEDAVDRELPEKELLAEAFGALTGRKVEVSGRQRWERRRLMEQASRNAVEALDRRLAETGTQARTSREMAEFLELADVPQRIEVEMELVKYNAGVGAGRSSFRFF